MAEDMVESLRECEPVGVALQVSSLGQGAARLLEPHPLRSSFRENVGFSFGMNRAIAEGVSYFGEPEYILCLNSDLQFPDKNWLSELLKEASPNHISVPTTDRTAIRIQAGPKDLRPVDTHEMSAYCWLVPFTWCKWLKSQYGYWLFDEEFESYGSDNWAAFLFSKKFGPKVFRLVRRSWVKHLRGKTSAVVKPDRRKSNRVLVAKLKRQLKYPNLRPDLRKWAQSYIKILTPRC